MTYLVTGALGALGAWAVRSLLDRGQEVVTYDLGGSDHRLRLALSDDGGRRAGAHRRRRHRPRPPRARDRRARGDERHPPRRAAGPVRARRPGARLEGQRHRHGQPARGGAAARGPHGPARLRLLDRRGARGGRVPEHAVRRLQARQRGHRGRLLQRLRRLLDRAAPAHALRAGPRPGADLGADRGDGGGGEGRGVRDPVRRLAAAAVHGRRRRAVRARQRGAGRGRVGAQPRRAGGDRGRDRRGDRVRGAGARQITFGEDPLPFPSELDSSSFTELVGGPVSRPLEQGVAEAIEAFRR